MTYVLTMLDSESQVCATELFRAFENGMQHAIQVNVKDMCISLQFALQLVPSNLWGEPLHTSGLFAYIVKGLKEDKVSES